MKQKIDGALFRRMVISASAAVDLNKQKINELNVFPVPDGDTGTNMGMTLGSAAADLKKNESPTLTKAADIAASAMLRGARGNSGVILSLLFRGFSTAWKGKHEADGSDFAAALTTGVEAAYKAVMKPAEGTILTVSRLTAAAARDLAGENADIQYVLEQSISTARSALENTVNQNPVLKKAGVVDAGGMGFCMILDGMLAALQGNDIVADEAPQTNEQADFGIFDTRTSRSHTIPSTSSARIPTSPSIRCASIWIPSVTALLSVRTTKRSRFTSIRTFPGRRSTSRRNTVRWSLQKSRTCGCSMTISPPDARRAPRTILSRSSRSWNPARPHRKRPSPPSATAPSLSAQARALRAYSAISA